MVERPKRISAKSMRQQQYLHQPYIMAIKLKPEDMKRREYYWTYINKEMPKFRWENIFLALFIFISTEKKVDVLPFVCIFRKRLFEFVMR